MQDRRIPFLRLVVCNPSRITCLLTGILPTVLLVLGAGFIPVAHAATIDVDTSDDESNGDGDCSLREAIQSANTDSAVDACTSGNGADTINIPSGIYVLSVLGAAEDAAATGDLDITDPLILVGAGAAATIIDGGGIDRVFHIIGTIIVEISGITIQNGNPPGEEGGGIFNPSGTLSVRDSIISNNTADFGGAISSSGTLDLVNSTVSTNFRTSIDPAGIMNSGNATLIGSTVSTHTQSGIRNSGTLKIIQSFVINNSVGGGGGSGGGIFNTGTLEINDSTISSNIAVGSGGGIFNTGTGAVATLSHSIVTDNRGKNGGGIFNSQGKLTLNDVVISGNTGLSGGGIINDGDFTLTNVTLSENGAFIAGGAIANAGTLDLRNSTVSANKSRGNGGGILNIGSVILTNVTVSGNEALNNGGGIHNTGNATLTNVTISDNTAISGGGIFSASPTTLKNTIVAESLSGGDCSGNIASTGHNLDSDATCSFTGIGDLSGINPQLGVLQNNGGSTFTQALLLGSPDIDAGDNADCPATDQRDISRPQPAGGICDIGAYEFVGSGAVLVRASKRFKVVRLDPLVLYEIVITNSGAGGQNDNPGPEFEDFIPTGTHFFAFTTHGTSASSGFIKFDKVRNEVVWNGAIPAGQSVILRFVVEVEGGGEVGVRERTRAAGWPLPLVPILIGSLLGTATLLWRRQRRLFFSLLVLVAVGLLAASCVGPTAPNQICNQGLVHFDSNGDGVNESVILTNDASTPTANDPTCFIVIP